MRTDEYIDPLTSRYSSKEMRFIFSDDNKFATWRKLWIALAEGEKMLGIDITDEQIDEMKAHIYDIDYDVAKAKEKEVRHDVMAHVHAFGRQCPKAMPIIHLGATSCYVGDNTDLIVYYQGLELVKKKLVNVISILSSFADRYKSLPTLGFTHLQPAQLVTVGKRACLWIQDLLMDLRDIEYLIGNYKLRGVKGTTGTQASFMQLFDNDGNKIDKLNEYVIKKMGFSDGFSVTGQTYPRKFDNSILSVLSGVAQSAYKFANDIRILQNMKEIEEPFEKSQIGSSAMAYKRNPMRSERICSLARYVVSLPINTAVTASTQWFERTLDDSANKRLVMAQGFLATDAILDLLNNVTDGLVVYEKVIDKHIRAELPFMATEVILMECVKHGGDRQELHEKIRVHSMEASREVKVNGKDNDLIDRVLGDDAFKAVHPYIGSILDAKNFIGRADRQVEEFIKRDVKPILSKYKEHIGIKSEINV